MGMQKHNFLANGLGKAEKFLNMVSSSMLTALSDQIPDADFKKIIQGATWLSLIFGTSSLGSFISLVGSDSNQRKHENAFDSIPSLNLSHKEIDPRISVAIGFQSLVPTIKMMMNEAVNKEMVGKAWNTGIPEGKIVEDGVEQEKPVAFFNLEVNSFDLTLDEDKSGFIPNEVLVHNQIVRSRLKEEDETTDNRAFFELHFLLN